MNMLETGLLIIHVLVAAAICGFVLLQHGKGADMGAAFGSGSSGSLFGAAGSANFLSRTTAILAAIFFASSLGLTWLATTTRSGEAGPPKGVMEKLAPKASDIPSTPGAAPGSPAGAAPVAAPASDASKVPAAPAAPAPDGSKASEVPK
jgi:preprotein translocase subunit SecG